MRVAIVTAMAASLFLSACVVPTGPVEVSRFNRVAEGQSYGSGSFVVVVAGNGENSLQSSPYTAAVEREMQKAGYSNVASGMESDVIAEVSAQIIPAGARGGRSPVSVGVGGSSGRYGSGVGVGVGVGMDITNLINKPKQRIITQLSVRILNRADKLVIWEGKAFQEASVGSPAAQPGIAASKLAEALFTDFPGNSGETVKIP